MKRSSLLKRYKKALRENKNLKEDKRRHIKQNFVTKLFFRIFLSSIILLLALLGLIVYLITKVLKRRYIAKRKVLNNTCFVLDFTKMKNVGQKSFFSSTLFRY